MAPAVGVERRRVQAGPAGMVFGGQKVPAGTLGANEGTNGAGTLWWRTGAGRSRTSRRSGPARLAATGLEGEGAVGAAQGRSQETEAGGAVACGNDGDDQMDRGAAPHGHLDLSQSPTVLEAAGKRTMRCENTTILRTDPFMNLWTAWGGVSVEEADWEKVWWGMSPTAGDWFLPFGDPMAKMPNANK